MTQDQTGRINELWLIGVRIELSAKNKETFRSFIGKLCFTPFEQRILKGTIPKNLFDRKTFKQTTVETHKTPGSVLHALPTIKHKFLRAEREMERRSLYEDPQ